MLTVSFKTHMSLEKFNELYSLSSVSNCFEEILALLLFLLTGTYERKIKIVSNYFSRFNIIGLLSNSLNLSCFSELLLKRADDS